MSSISEVSKKYKQPKGGFVKPGDMVSTQFKNLEELYPIELETSHPSTVGTIVEYIARVILGTPKEEVFQLSLAGASFMKPSNVKEAMDLLNKINGVDEQSIISAFKLIRYESVARLGETKYKMAHEINVSIETIYNVRVMVDRGVLFLKTFSDVRAGLKLSGLLSKNVLFGEIDFLTPSTVIDFKVSVNKPTSKHTLQLIMYYYIGKIEHPILFEKIEKIGIFNPRLNMYFESDSISNFTVENKKEIMMHVIGYDDYNFENIEKEFKKSIPAVPLIDLVTGDYNNVEWENVLAYHGEYLKKIPLKHQTQKMVEIAVISNPESIRWASKKLQTLSIARIAVNFNPDLLKYTKRDLKKVLMQECDI